MCNLYVSSLFITRKPLAIRTERSSTQVLHLSFHQHQGPHVALNTTSPQRLLVLQAETEGVGSCVAPSGDWTPCHPQSLIHGPNTLDMYELRWDRQVKGCLYSSWQPSMIYGHQDPSPSNEKEKKLLVAWACFKLRTWAKAFCLAWWQGNLYPWGEFSCIWAEKHAMMLKGNVAVHIIWWAIYFIARLYSYNIFIACHDWSSNRLHEPMSDPKRELWTNARS